ncbi:hypothetical protein [Halalkalibacter oceani]|uniref:hypothetical protein n=1 Tax=Halalkalibacter oceani TaxID=1653776 RepID=UPI00339873C1
MLITNFKKGEKIKIINVNAIRQGEMLWSNGDIVEVREVENEGLGYDRLDVWDKERYLSEYIYPDEFIGIKKL